jgi:hypothetical protein
VDQEFEIPLGIERASLAQGNLDRTILKTGRSAQRSLLRQRVRSVSKNTRTDISFVVKDMFTCLWKNM